MNSNVSELGISESAESTTEFSTCGLSLRTHRSKSPIRDFKAEPISTSSVSDSSISISGESITEFSTSGLSLRTDRSKSPFVLFKDEQISTSELVSAWLDQVEIRSSEPEPPSLTDLVRLLQAIDDELKRITWSQVDFLFQLV